jgi:peptidoglycan-associated lipoprotein
MGSSWVEPEKLKLFADTINVGHPSLSPDGKMLVVASDAANGFGGKDLYYFLKTDTGWSAPYNLGTNINTKGDEVFPWLDEKGNLYYASNGLPGMGSLDIFRAVREKKGWKEPTNLEAPINSGADDFGYIIEKYKPTSINDEVLKAGYFSSNRAGGKGSDDIYSFSERWVNYFVLNGLVQEKSYLQADNPDSELKGMKAIDKVMLVIKSDVDSITLVSNAAGIFTTPLKTETDYKLTAYKPGYFSNTGTFSTNGKRNQDSTYIYIPTAIELNRIFPQKEIVIPNIYYDYNKATLRDESKLVLDSILIFFSDNKDLAIEIGSHTDSRGSDSYNEKLSQARAQSVVDYLILKGVEQSRLTAKGYGETKLTNQCANGVECTEEEHQKNRRTTFRILGSSKVIESTTPEDIKVVPKE